jgi:RNA polymerase sigma factor (sigma-70 family)
LTDLEKILEGCKKNDRSAQAGLSKLLAPKLLGLCIRYLQNRDEAEDAMQDAFVKIFTNIASFKGSGSFEGWAKRVAVNTALTALKDRNKISFERHTDDLEQIGMDDEAEPLALSSKEILDCMKALPVGYRTIVNLFLVEEFSHKEIAEKLNITESTSRSQYSRARQTLMKLIKEKTEPMVTKHL